MAALLGIVLAHASGAASADEREWRLAFAAGGGAGGIVEEHRRGWAPVVGGDLRVAYGATDFLDVGLQLGLLAAPALAFPGASLRAQPGTLYGDEYAPAAAIDLRFIGGPALTPRLARVHPFLGLSGGLVVDVLANRLLLDATTDAVVLRLGTAARVLGTASVYAGVEYRLRRAWALGARASAAVDSDLGLRLTAAFEVSWFTY